MVIKSNTALGLPLIVTVVTTTAIPLVFFSAANVPEVWLHQRIMAVSAANREECVVVLVVITLPFGAIFFQPSGREMNANRWQLCPSTPGSRR